MGIAVHMFETMLTLLPFCLQVAQLDVGKKAVIDEIVGLGWLLGSDVSREEAAKAMNLR